MTTFSTGPSKEEIRAWGLELGFDRVGFASAVEPEGVQTKLQTWLGRGYHADMGWMARDPERRTDPNLILEGAKSVIVVAQQYLTREPVPSRPDLPRVSRYAHGRDYHEVIGERLHALRERIEVVRPTLRSRIACDTSPIHDKAYGRAGGLGWIGKNTCLIDRDAGSWFFLGEMFTDLELTADVEVTDSCGSCRACLDACPTDAFPEPYVLDANRCIAYWNIEHRGDFPHPWGEKIQDWLVGCDICQEVCPWNRKAPESQDPDMQANEQIVGVSLDQWSSMEPQEYRARIRHSAISRVKPADMKRNAAAVSRNKAEAGEGARQGAASPEEPRQGEAEREARGPDAGGPSAGGPEPGGPSARGPEPQGQDLQRQDLQRRDLQRRDLQRQDLQRQDPRGRNAQVQDPQGQNPQVQDPQVQDPQGQDPQGQDPRGRNASGQALD